VNLLFQVLNGRSAGQQLRLAPGEVRKVGRGPGVDLAVPYDSALAEIHFALQYLDQVCRIRALSNARTLLNGQATTAAVLQDGDQVEAGGTRFLCKFAGAARKAGQVPTLSAFLAEQPEPAFAVLDSARSPEIPDLLRDLGSNGRSLFPESRAEEYRTVAPYLVALPTGSNRGRSSPTLAGARVGAYS
jgi:predicted component of type VI protein secretion system